MTITITRGGDDIHEGDDYEVEVDLDEKFWVEYLTYAIPGKIDADTVKSLIEAGIIDLYDLEEQFDGDDGFNEYLENHFTREIERQLEENYGIR